MDQNLFYFPFFGSKVFNANVTVIRDLRAVTGLHLELLPLYTVFCEIT